jgi:hypothetical protein
VHAQPAAARPLCPSHWQAIKSVFFFFFFFVFFFFFFFFGGGNASTVNDTGAHSVSACRDIQDPNA